MYLKEVVPPLPPYVCHGIGRGHPLRMRSRGARPLPPSRASLEILEGVAEAAAAAAELQQPQQGVLL